MGRSIQEMYDKFKYLLKDDSVFYGTLIILVAIISFGLGRWSIALQSTSEHQKPEKSIQVLMPASVSTAVEKENVVSTKEATSTPVVVPQAEKSMSDQEVVQNTTSSPAQERNKSKKPTKSFLPPKRTHKKQDIVQQVTARGSSNFTQYQLQVV